MHDPLLAVFLLRGAQLQMAIGVVFQLVTAPDQTLRRVKAGNANIFFMPGLPPGLGSKPPADDKKRRLYAILVEDIGQARTRMDRLAAKKDIRAWSIVKCKRNQLISRRRSSNLGDRAGRGRWS